MLMAGLLAGSVSSGGAQQRGAAPKVSLVEVARNLPDYVDSQPQPAYIEAIDGASVAERDAALPLLMHWIDDERPKVRGLALLSLNLVYIPTETRPQTMPMASLPVEYIPAVAAHLRDPDPAMHNVTFAALQTVEYSGNGMDVLVKLVLPMLREPDVVIEYPDPFFVESDKQMLATMTPDQQAAFLAQPRKVMKLPAEGSGLVGILATQRTPSNTVDDAMIAFLDRDDQTKSTLGDCLHTLALSAASERVNDEALRRVFEVKGMTIFLLQFVADMRLTQVEVATERARLIALSNDESAHPSLRRSAKVVAACWTGERIGRCKPSDADLSEQLDTR